MKPCGKIQLGNNYSYVASLYTRTADTRGKYLVGCMIQGPKGGTYVLGLTGTQVLFKQVGLTPHYGKTLCTITNRQGQMCSGSVMFEFDNIKIEDAAKELAKKMMLKYIKKR